MGNDNAQMMILEAIFFGITVSIALAFIFQISPSSIQSGTENSNELKTIGDAALGVTYIQTMHIIDAPGETYKTNNPQSKLTVCIITNNYDELVSSLNEILSDTILYNIYISNGTKTIFWCSITQDKTNKITMVDPVSISYFPISIDPNFLKPEEYGGFFEGHYLDNDRSDIWDDFIDPTLEEPYEGSSYEVILEMSYLLPS